MTDRKIIAVLGSTGAQGGGLVRAILNDSTGTFTARAITRNPDSEKARALAAGGAEVVGADLNDVASLQRAFAGAHGIYGVTFYWDHVKPELETTHGRNIAKAAGAARADHVIWSTFEDTRTFVPLDDDRMPTLLGSYKVPHFDAKAEANAAFTEAGVPTTFLYTSFYWENFIFFGSGPKPGPDGVLALTFPLGHAKMPGIAAEDIGRCALGIFKKGDTYLGRAVGIAGEHLSGAEMAAALGRALGREVRYNDVPADVYRGFGFPGADDVGNMLQFKRDFESDYRRMRSVEESRALNPDLQTLNQWLATNASRIPLE